MSDQNAPSTDSGTFVQLFEAWTRLPRIALNGLFAVPAPAEPSFTPSGPPNPFGPKPKAPPTGLDPIATRLPELLYKVMPSGQRRYLGLASVASIQAQSKERLQKRSITSMPRQANHPMSAVDAAALSDAEAHMQRVSMRKEPSASEGRSFTYVAAPMSRGATHGNTSGHAYRVTKHKLNRLQKSISGRSANDAVRKLAITQHWINSAGEHDQVEFQIE